MKKKICIALIGALTAAAFAGCSGGGSSQRDKGAPVEVIFPE